MEDAPLLGTSQVSSKNPADIFCASFLKARTFIFEGQEKERLLYAYNEAMKNRFVNEEDLRKYKVQIDNLKDQYSQEELDKAYEDEADKYYLSEKSRLKIEQVQEEFRTIEQHREKIKGFIDPLMQGMSLKEIISDDHYGYVFSASNDSIIRKGILYYIHGGPQHSISNPYTMIDGLKSYLHNSSYSITDLSDAYSENIGTTHFTGDLTIRTLTIFKILAEEGYVVVALNYPGHSKHGNHYDPSYLDRVSEHLEKLGPDDKRYTLRYYKENFESELADIIKRQITDITPKIKANYKMDSSSSTTYWGHSLGGDIAQFILRDREFLQKNLTSVIIANPTVSFEYQGHPDSQKTQHSIRIAERLTALESVECPILVTIIAGAKDTNTVTAENAKPMFDTLAKNNTHVRYIEIPEANHAPHNLLDGFPSGFDQLSAKEKKIIVDYFEFEQERDKPIYIDTEEGFNILKKIIDIRDKGVHIFINYVKAILDAAN